jgi:hypothetical protein
LSWFKNRWKLKTTTKTTIFYSEQYGVNEIGEEIGISRLPVLEALVKIGCSLESWESIVFICVQHLLPTTASLFYALVRLGVKLHNIYLLGKRYSTNLPSKQKITKLGIHLFSDNQSTTKKRVV